MPSTTAEQKKQLRKSVRSLLTTLSPEERTGGDRAMFQAFLSPAGRSGRLALFSSSGGIAGLEPDTGSLAASLTKLGKTGLSAPGSPRLRDGVPVYRPELPMAISDFGIQEPTEQAPLIRPRRSALPLSPLCAMMRADAAWASGEATTTAGWRASPGPPLACAGSASSSGVCR